MLKEAEAVINSQPLVYIGEDINSDMTLTPAHFLSLNPKIGLPKLDLEDNDDNEFSPKISSAETLIITWKKGLKHLNKFWKVCKNDYLLNLRERTQNKLKSPRIQTSGPAKIGHVVIIKDDHPRGCWRIGKIVELIKGRDQQIRAAKVCLPSKTVVGHPLNLLYPMECPEDDRNTDDESPENGSQEKCQSEDRTDRTLLKDKPLKGQLNKYADN